MSFELLDTGVVALPDGPLAAVQNKCDSSSRPQQKAASGSDKPSNLSSFGQPRQSGSGQSGPSARSSGRTSPFKSTEAPVGPGSAAFAPPVGARAGRLECLASKALLTHTPGKGLKIASGSRSMAPEAHPREVLPLTKSVVWGRCETNWNKSLVALLTARRNLKSHRCAALPGILPTFVISDVEASWLPSIASRPQCNGRVARCADCCNSGTVLPRLKQGL